MKNSITVKRKGLVDVVKTGKARLLLLGGAALLIGGGITAFWPETGEVVASSAVSPAERKALVDQAYKEGQEAIARRGAELEAWYRGQKNGPTAAVARELTSLKSKWEVGKSVVSGGEEARNEYLAGVIRKHMYTEEECKKQTMHQVAALLKDWLDVEDRLSVDADCPSLSLKEKMNHAPQHSPVHGKVDVDGKMLGMLLEELGSVVGGEVLTMVATELATSAGILGVGTALSVETFGIGLAVGILVDVAVGWFMDTEGKLQRELDAGVDKSARDARMHFEAAMNKALDKRREEWIRQLGIN